MSLNQEHLANMTCATPGCDHMGHEPLFLHARCHPSEGCRVSYHPERGELEVRCRRCKKLVASVEVAP